MKQNFLSLHSNQIDGYVRWGIRSVVAFIFALGMAASTLSLYANPTTEEVVNPLQPDSINARSFDADGWSRDLSFPGFDGEIHGMKTIGDDLYVWGNLRSVSGVTAETMVKLSGQTGLWSNVSLSHSPRIYDIMVSGEQMYIAGAIHLNGITHGVAIYDGTNWTPLGGAFNEVVHAIAWHQGQLYATGAFTHIDGVRVNHIARWDGTQWHPMGSGLISLYGAIKAEALLSTGDTLYVGGHFGLAGGVQVKNLAAWQNNQWKKAIDMDGDVEALAWDGASMYVAAYTVYNGQPLSGVVRIQNEQLFPLGGGLNPGANVTMLLLANGGIFVTGPGIRYGTNADNSITQLTDVAFFDGGRWHPMGEAFADWLGGSSYMNALGLWRGQVAVAGNFVRSGGKALPGLAFWDGVQWNRPPAVPGISFGVNGDVIDMTVYGDSLYAVGRFTLAGDVDVPGVARWDGQNWHPVGDGTLGGLQRAGLIAVNSSGVYLAGPHRLEDGISMWSVAHWNGAEWRLIGNHLNGELTKLFADASSVYVSGFMRPFHADDPRGVARWDGASWTFYDRDPFYGRVDDVIAVGGNVYACGQHLPHGGTNVPVLTRWVGSRWESVLPEHVHPNCLLSIYQDSIFLTASLIDQDPLNPNITRGVLLRITGSQWEVESNLNQQQLHLLALIPAENGDLYSRSYEILPQQFNSDDSQSTFIPIANLHWRVGNKARFLPLPRSNMISTSHAKSTVVAYKGVLVFGGAISNYSPRSDAMRAWKPLSADVSLSLASPAEAKVGQTLPVTGTIDLLEGTSAPYVMAVLNPEAPDFLLQNGSNARCNDPGNNYNESFGNHNNGRGMLECAWRHLKEGERDQFYFSVTPSNLGRLQLIMDSWWSGNDTNSANDQATTVVNVYDIFTATPEGGFFLYYLGEERSVDITLPKAAISTTVEVRIEQGVAPPPAEGLAVIQPIFQLSTSQTGREESAIELPISANVGYAEVDSYRVDEGTLSLHRYDTSSKTWVPSHLDCNGAAPSEPKPDINSVRAHMCRTGIYALVGEAMPTLFLPRISRAY
jgi:hypothetical protein